jgi:vancomycin resistance protein YoaR
MFRQLRSIVGLLLVTCLGFASGILLYGALCGGLVPSNTWIGDLYIGERTPGQAVELLQWMNDSMRQRTLVLIAQDERYLVQADRIGVQIDMARAQDLVDDLVRSNTVWRRALGSIRSANHDTYVPLPMSFDQSAVDALIDELAKRIDQPPVDARYNIASRRFVPEKPGYMVDRTALVSAMMDGFQQVGPAVIDVPISVVSPSVTLELLERLQISECISSYQTTFDASDKPRSSNIKLAAELVDGTILLPSEEFSFNRRVGPRTREAGFLEAIEIVDNEYVIGVGGGVCQVSSTLYNAAVLARLEIIERRPHSRVSTYVPAGRDATVYYPVIDLRFRNSLERPVMISAQVESNVVRVAVIGSPLEARRVEFVTRTIATLLPQTNRVADPTLAPGKEVVEQESATGVVVEAYRRVFADDGSLVSEEIVSRDTYPPVNRVVRVGTGM